MQLPARTIQSLFLATIAGCGVALEEERPPARQRHAVLHVAAAGGAGPGDSALDLAAALELATEQTRIELGAGEFILDNPVRIRVRDVTLAGQGMEKTILRPRHPGPPLLVMAGDGQTVEDLTLNALLPDAAGRASTGVLVEDHRSRCRLRRIAVVGTAGSAVAGLAGIRDCRVEDSFLLDSGNDGIQLRGSNIAVTGNVILRYYDEAVDLNSGSDILVHANCMADGRIGIAMTVGRAVVTSNVIQQSHMQGIYLESTDSGGVLSQNHILGSAEEGLVAVRPRLVSSNKVRGSGRVGIELRDMRRGILKHNLVSSAPVGFSLLRSRGNLVHDNVFAGSHGQGLVMDQDSQENRMLANRLEGVPGPSRAWWPWQEDAANAPTPACADLLSPGLARRLHASKERRHGLPVDIRAASPGEREILTAVAAFLDRNNPGYVSLSIEDGVLVSEITGEHLHTLREVAPRSVGHFRWPMLLFGKLAGDPQAEWSLRHGGAEVARVWRLQTAPGAAIELR